MQGWMIALIVIAAVIAVIAVAVLVMALAFVHAVLGRRKPLGDTAEHIDDKYGVDLTWFDTVKDFTTVEQITAYDGIKLGAKLISRPEHTGRIAVCCHGYGVTATSVQPQAKLFYDRGFDVLLPCMRGHDGSEGKVGMAWIDRFDILRWLDKIVADRGETVQIALFGISMGGSTAVAAAGMNPPPQLKCVIDDCGFNSQYDEYVARLNVLSRPTWFMRLINIGVKLVHGYSIYDADIVPLAANANTPILFIHGERDRVVPIELGKKLYEAYAAQDKEFLSVSDAEHACSYTADKDGYVDAFTAFVDKHVDGSAPVVSPEPAEVDQPATEETAAPAEE